MFYSTYVLLLFVSGKKLPIDTPGVHAL